MEVFKRQQQSFKLKMIKKKIIKKIKKVFKTLLLVILNLEKKFPRLKLQKEN
jgi:hypothetical protein